MLEMTTPLPASLRTERLVLRRPRSEDSSACFALEGDPATARHRPGGPLDRAASDADLARNIRDWAEDGLGYWMVEWQGQVVGRTGLRRIDAPTTLLPGVPPERLLNTYYRFAPRVWGTGMPTEAARAALDAARVAGLRYPVVAITTPDNEPSQQMALRLGMVAHRRLRVDGLPDTVELRLPGAG